TREVFRGADVVLAVGANLFPSYIYLEAPLLDPTIPLIHLDSQADEIGKTITPEVGIHADPKLGLNELGQAIETLQRPADREAASRRRGETAAEKGRRAEAFQGELQGNWDKAPIHPKR